MTRCHAAAALASLLPLLFACERGPGPASQLEVRIAGVPHVLQRPGLAGEACVEMALRKHDLPGADQDYIFSLTKLDPGAGGGCYAAGLARAVERLGFQRGLIERRVPPGPRGAALVREQWRTILEDLVLGVPSVVCMTGGETGAEREAQRFRLLLGYSTRTGRVTYHDPARPDGAHRQLPLSTFLRRWPIAYSSARRRHVVRIRLERDAAPTRSRAGAIAAADYAQHIAKLRRLLPDKGFTIVLQPPFVVVGDEPARRVRERARTTVAWATRRLKQDFFPRDPPWILTVWLFKDRRSYLRHTRALFGRTPSTPYGYYSREHRALVMNINTGGGTLVHEMVHPFIEANFPGCPAWFNEGLGSLFEACEEDNGRIRGLLNWRLPGLQAALRAGRVPSFKALTGRTQRDFYGRDPGTNYSQSRYLCYYLQQRGLLRRFYRTFLRDRGRDPTGYATLQRVLDEPDMAAFQRRWSTWVLNLGR
jgi:hypothetical protein